MTAVTDLHLCGGSQSSGWNGSSLGDLRNSFSFWMEMLLIGLPTLTSPKSKSSARLY